MDYLKEEFQGPWELEEIFVDDGLTGTDDSRESFQRMIAAVKEGVINCVVCKTLSRAFRNYADQGYFLEEFFPRYRTRFISVGNPRVDSFLDPEAVQMGLEIPINGILNDRYAAKTSADVRRTLDMKRRRGSSSAPLPPMATPRTPPTTTGWSRTEKRPRWWRRSSSGMSKGREGTIARQLNHRGIPNPTAYKARQGSRYRRPGPPGDGLWTAATVGRILQNPVYGGDHGPGPALGGEL